MSLRYGYTIATRIHGERVVKRYVGMDAAERMGVEVDAIERTACPCPESCTSTGPPPARAISGDRPRSDGKAVGEPSRGANRNALDRQASLDRSDREVGDDRQVIAQPAVEDTLP